MKERNCLLAALIPVSLSLFVSCGADSQQFTPSSQQRQVAEYFKSSEEPVVVDAIWASETIFRLGAVHDGSDRSGYAQYACAVLADYSIQDVDVQIINIQELVSNGEWVVIGRARCS